MIIRKNSKSYKKGIKYTPNLDTIISNSEKPVRVNCDYSYKSIRETDDKFYWWDLVTAKSE
jgi:hypothetical protein